MRRNRTTPLVMLPKAWAKTPHHLEAVTYPRLIPRQSSIVRELEILVLITMKKFLTDNIVFLGWAVTEQEVSHTSAIISHPAL